MFVVAIVILVVVLDRVHQILGGLLPLIFKNISSLVADNFALCLYAADADAAAGEGAEERPEKGAGDDMDADRSWFKYQSHRDRNNISDEKTDKGFGEEIRGAQHHSIPVA